MIPVGHQHNIIFCACIVHLCSCYLILIILNNIYVVTCALCLQFVCSSSSSSSSSSRLGSSVNSFEVGDTMRLGSEAVKKDRTQLADCDTVLSAGVRRSQLLEAELHRVRGADAVQVNQLLTAKCSVHCIQRCAACSSSLFIQTCCRLKHMS